MASGLIASGLWQWQVPPTLGMIVWLTQHSLQPVFLGVSTQILSLEIPSQNSAVLKGVSCIKASNILLSVVMFLMMNVTVRAEPASSELAVKCLM